MRKDKIIQEIKILREKYIKCRAYFPYISSEMMGQKQFITPPLYRGEGHTCIFQFHEPITEKDIKNNNEIGHWINQNVIIRLYALLDSNHIVSNKVKIRKEIDSWEYVDILRRLRGIFAHASGHYDKKNDDHKKLIAEINKQFNLSYDPEELVEFPLSIDKIISPLFNGCIGYIKNLVKFEKS